MLLDRKRVGLILRTFSPKPELVPETVARVMKTVQIARDLEVSSRRVFARIDILVSADERYGDSDCGHTAQELRDRVSTQDRVFISEVKNGDIFCGILNYGVAHQLRERIDYSMILSSGVNEYLTEENVAPMLGALECGARVTGLAFEELAPSVLAGRIANTFAIWDTVALMTVGGFDLRAAKAPKDDRLARYVRGWSIEKGEVFYGASGVEEVIPIIRLIKTFGPCLAPITPRTQGAWTVSQDPEVQARHRKKLGTKFERQMMWALSEGVDFSFIEGGVMLSYQS